MGGYTGKYSRNPFSVFNEEKNYAIALMQEGVPVTDDDQNDGRLMLFTRQRRMAQLFGNYGTPNDGFRIVPASAPANNITVQSGSGPSNADIEAAGRFFMRGISCVLLHDVDYKNSLTDLAEQSIHPRVTNVYYDGSTYTVIEDSAANWIDNEHNTKQVVVDGVPYTINDTTQDELKIVGNHATLIANGLGKHYRIELKPPGAGTREDGVYLNVYLDEYDSTDDPDMLKVLGGTEIEAQLRAKVIQTIYVRDDVPGNGELTDYVDANGNQHYVFKLATLDRTTSDNITTITDHVPTIGFEDIGSAKLTALRVDPTTPASDQVIVRSGTTRKVGGEGYVQFIGTTYSYNFPAAPATQSYYALIYIDDAGNIGHVNGSPSATPTPPYMQPHYRTSLAYVEVDDTATITDAEITDIRPWLGESPGSVHVYDSTLTFAQNVAVMVGISDSCKRLYCPSGSYTIDSAISASGIEIFGDGADNTRFDFVTGGILTLSTGAVLRDVRIAVTSGTIPYPVFATGSSNPTPIVIDHCRFEADGGTVDDTSLAVGVTGSSVNLVVTRCFFDAAGFDSDTTHIWMETARGIRIDDCTFEDLEGSSTSAQIVVGQTTDVEIRGCLFRLYGAGSGESCVFVAGGVPDFEVKLTISNCNFFLAFSTGIQTFDPPNCHYVKIHDNTVYLDYESTFIRDIGQTYTISDNTVHGRDDDPAPTTFFIYLTFPVMGGATVDGLVVSDNEVIDVEFFYYNDGGFVFSPVIADNLHQIPLASMLYGTVFFADTSNGASFAPTITGNNVLHVQPGGLGVGISMSVMQDANVTGNEIYAQGIALDCETISDSIISSNHLFSSASPNVHAVQVTGSMSDVGICNNYVSSTSGNGIDVTGFGTLSNIWIHDNEILVGYGDALILYANDAASPLEQGNNTLSIRGNQIRSQQHAIIVNYCWERIEVCQNQIWVDSDVDGDASNPDVSPVQFYQDQDWTAANKQDNGAAPIIIVNDNNIWWRQENKSYIQGGTGKYYELDGNAAAIHFWLAEADAVDTLALNNGLTIQNNTILVIVNIEDDATTGSFGIWFSHNNTMIENIKISDNFIRIEGDTNEYAFKLHGINFCLRVGSPNYFTGSQYVENAQINGNDIMLTLYRTNVLCSATGIYGFGLDYVSICDNRIKLEQKYTAVATGTSHGIFAYDVTTASHLRYSTITGNAVWSTQWATTRGVQSYRYTGDAFSGNQFRQLFGTTTESISQPTLTSDRNAFAGNVFTAGQAIIAGNWTNTSQGGNILI